MKRPLLLFKNRETLHLDGVYSTPSNGTFVVVPQHTQGAVQAYRHGLPVKVVPIDLDPEVAGIN